MPIDYLAITPLTSFRTNEGLEIPPQLHGRKIKPITQEKRKHFCRATPFFTYSKLSRFQQYCHLEELTSQGFVKRLQYFKHYTNITTACLAWLKTVKNESKPVTVFL